MRPHHLPSTPAQVYLARRQNHSDTIAALAAVYEEEPTDDNRRALYRAQWRSHAHAAKGALESATLRLSDAIRWEWENSDKPDSSPFDRLALERALFAAVRAVEIIRDAWRRDESEGFPVGPSPWRLPQIAHRDSPTPTFPFVYVYQLPETPAE